LKSIDTADKHGLTVWSHTLIASLPNTPSLQQTLTPDRVGQLNTYLVDVNDMI